MCWRDTSGNELKLTRCSTDRGTTDAIYIVREAQENFFAADRPSLTFRKNSILSHGMLSGRQCAK